MKITILFKMKLEEQFEKNRTLQIRNILHEQKELDLMHSEIEYLTETLGIINGIGKKYINLSKNQQ